MVDGRRAIADGALSCRTRLRARSVGDRHHRAMPARILAAGVGSARDLPARRVRLRLADQPAGLRSRADARHDADLALGNQRALPDRRSHAARAAQPRSEEQTSELQSLMRISYAVFCLKKKNNTNTYIAHTQ